MDNPKKLAIQGIQDEEEQSQNTIQYVLGATMCKCTK